MTRAGWQALALAAVLTVGGSAGNAQTAGAIAGQVSDSLTGRALADVEVALAGGRHGAITNMAGAYRIREVRAGWHRVVARRIGYGPVARDSVLVRVGQTTRLDFRIGLFLELAPVVVEARVDSVLDPTLAATVQRITATDLRRLPVTTLEEAVGLAAGAVGESYRGGRVGQHSFILDGLGVKNQLDASTGGAGFRPPPDLLTEAGLVTNGFSARYGQAISGMINVVTRDPEERWRGRVAYETDRPLGAGGDYGLDRAIAAAEGGLGRHVALLAVLDAEGRLDADPVHAPAPADPRDPRAARPYLLPHNSGERLDASLKLTAPLDGRHTLRLLALRSVERRLLYDPAYKYDVTVAPARRVRGALVSAHLQRAPSPGARVPVSVDVRLGYFVRDFFRGALARPPEYRFGAFTGGALMFLGEELARRQDTAAARGPVQGFLPPEPSARTPWGVPAFFLGDASRGEIAWNRFTELRGRLDLGVGAGPHADVYVGAEVVRQGVATFQRALAYLPAGDSVPPPAASSYAPLAAAAYAETQVRGEDFTASVGLRLDRVDPRADLPGAETGARYSLSPRFAFSTVLRGATLVVSWGRFTQAPDYQYLTDAAFDDTARTGRFRRGNPNLGFEDAHQYEFNLRARPTPATAVRAGVYVRRLDGLVASVPLGLDPDSSIFGNSDFGTVKGLELLLEQELGRFVGFKVAYNWQQAQATATDAFELAQRIRVDSITGDTIDAARVEFPLDYDRRHGLTVIAQARVSATAGPVVAGVRPLGGLEVAVVARYLSGLPYTRTDATGDTLIGLPNSHRLPGQLTFDLLLRRPIRLAGRTGSVYLDVRNLLNRRNVEALRRETGEPGLGATELQAAAEAAYRAHPEAIPYESPRYRAFADADGDGLILGRAELFPLYLAAARDFFQPLFAYGPPRLVRLGVELHF